MDTLPASAHTDLTTLFLKLQLRGGEAYNWLLSNVLAPETILQLAITTAAMLTAILLANPLQQRMRNYLSLFFHSDRQLTLRDSLANVIFPLVWLLLQSMVIAASQKVGWPSSILDMISVLLLAWIIIRLTAGFVSSPFWSKLITLTAWAFASLSILGLLNPTIAFLDRMAVSVGTLHISALGVLKAVSLLSSLLWLAVVVSRAAERRIKRSRTLTPSVQELTSKLLKFFLVMLAIIVSLTSVGIDLTAFAVFSGALGVGIGFGLQKVVSNLISGIILLLDRSIKPGDVIELGDTYGWINTLGARFVSVITRDGKEHLIPNEDLITQRVINWSYSDTNVRLKVPVNVSYDSDVYKAIDLLVEAARETPRVLESPAPRALLIGFSENAIMLELRIWACDPNNGVMNLKSAVLLKVWDKFRANDIHFPFAQRDVHLDLAPTTVAALQGKELPKTTGKSRARPITNRRRTKKH